MAAHSHPAGWARSSLESAEAAALLSHAQVSEAPHPGFQAAPRRSRVRGQHPAQASGCSSALIHDWYVDGRIDRTYPVHCYREALKDDPGGSDRLRDAARRPQPGAGAGHQRNNGSVGRTRPCQAPAAAAPTTEQQRQWRQPRRGLLPLGRQEVRPQHGGLCADPPARARRARAGADRDRRGELLRAPLPGPQAAPDPPPADPPRAPRPVQRLESGLAATIRVTSGPVSMVQIPFGGASSKTQHHTDRIHIHTTLWRNSMASKHN